MLVNYIDRINLSVAAPQLQQEFGLGNAQLGLLFSAFFWAYALLQIPSGVLLDRFGVTRIGRLSILSWSVASMLVAVTGGFGGLLLARLLLGVAEAPGFPANAKAVGHWFPLSERATATAIFDAAAKFSNVVGVPLVAVVTVGFGWRWGFAATAALSLGYFLAFWRFYRDPSADPHLSASEYRFISAGGATREGSSSRGSGGMLLYLLGNRKVWGLTMGFACYGYCFYFLLTWLPGYLVQTMHQSILESAGYTAIPWLCATLADLIVGGWWVDRLIRQGRDESRVRKSVLVVGMLLGLAVFGAVLTRDPRWAIFWISLSLSGLAAAAPVGWSIPALIAPRGATASVGSIMNFANNVMGIAAPLATGAIVAVTHSFAGAFFSAGVILLAGILSYLYVLGDIAPIPEPPEKSAS
ncbi:MAG TPA: MFS transporter [Steroidobacteraceae bacterium]|nr:MFS transporter [Steroidobacteraceae bacterium]